MAGFPHVREPANACSNEGSMQDPDLFKFVHPPQQKSFGLINQFLPII